MKEIKLTKGKFALVDDEDYEELSQRKWCLCNGYAARTVIIKPGKQVWIQMHRWVNRTPKGLDTDHINGNKLDNTRANLRTATRSQNKANEGVHLNNTSGHRGVSWNKHAKKWTAQIKVNQKYIHLGISKDKKDVVQMYNLAAQKHFGSFAKLNPI